MRAPTPVSHSFEQELRRKGRLTTKHKPGLVLSVSSSSSYGSQPLPCKLADQVLHLSLFRSEVQSCLLSTSPALYRRFLLSYFVHCDFSSSLVHKPDFLFSRMQKIWRLY